ncbi:hypothetical protein [Pseudomonas syringae]|uniref:hypothetical protein n=1 Tax=Pseudomonas syringae TaxID=317 RepID=UPI0012901FAC|nr:hypothetical protein [Pseudomonas syringae]
MILPGRKHGVDTGLFYLNARMLGEIALQLESELDDKVIAVLFRDSDGTNSSPRDIWERKTLSMIEGFKSANFHRGVPMVPRPKSEVWFLCAMKDNPYQHCASLENLPGNDSSPNSAKNMLSGVLQGEATADVLLRWLCENRLSVQDIAEQMPSFSAFYQRFVEVLNDL